MLRTSPPRRQPPSSPNSNARRGRWLLSPASRGEEEEEERKRRLSRRQKFREFVCGRRRGEAGGVHISCMGGGRERRELFLLLPSFSSGRPNIWQRGGGGGCHAVRNVPLSPPAILNTEKKFFDCFSSKRKVSTNSYRLLR